MSADFKLRALRGPQVYGKNGMTGLSRSEVYRQIREGRFPVGFMLGRSTRVWFEHEVGEWLLAQSKNQPGDLDEQIQQAIAAGKAKRAAKKAAKLEAQNAEASA